MQKQDFLDECSQDGCDLFARTGGEWVGLLGSIPDFGTDFSYAYGKKRSVSLSLKEVPLCKCSIQNAYQAFGAV